MPPGDANRFDMRRIDWFDLRNMLLVARIVAEAALARTESRGAQQREDYPEMSPNGPSISLSGCAMGASRCRRRPATGTAAAS